IDADIRASFIGMDNSHKRSHFIRAILEGITFSLNESLELFRNNGKKIDSIISIGGGAKSDIWLQIQADIFDTKIITLQNEQGPGIGAAMLAAYGCEWYETLQGCAREFLEEKKRFYPRKENAKKYKKIFNIYKEVYGST